MPPRTNTVPKPELTLDEPFELDSITRSEPPDGGAATNWHRYVITQGRNRIVGHLQGPQASIQRTVKDIVQRLNERRMGRTGRTPQASGRKK